QAERCQQSCELGQQIRDIAVCGEQLQVNEAQQEPLIQNTELAARIRHYSSINCTISRVMPAVSCSIANCAKISSSVGSDINVRKCSIESLATTFPLCRITTREDTRSTMSRSWVLNRITLPRAASSAIRLRSTSA